MSMGRNGSSLAWMTTLHIVRREQRIDERVVLLIEGGEQHIVGKVVEHKQWV